MNVEHGKITLTIGLDINELRSAAAMLAVMADAKEGIPTGIQQQTTIAPPAAPEPGQKSLEELQASPDAEALGMVSTASEDEDDDEDLSSTEGLDTEGLPYDSRIHTAGNIKKTKKDGKWKIARNTPPALVEQVKAELRALMAAKPPETTVAQTETKAPAPAPSAATPPPPAPTPAPAQEEVKYLVGEDEFTAEQLHASGWTDEQISTLEVVTEESETTQGGAMNFPEFMAEYMKRLATDPALKDRVLAELAGYGISQLSLLGGRPDLIPGIAEKVFI